MNNKEILLLSFYAINLYWEDEPYHVDFTVHQTHTINNYTKETREYIDSTKDQTDDGWNSTDKTIPAFIKGSIKWDGCINYDYPGLKDCMLHECGLYSFKEHLKIFEIIYNEAAELMASEYLKDILKEDKT